MDVEEVCITHYHWMRITGELRMTTRSEPLKTYLAKDMISGFNEDKWKELPSLIVIENATSWALMISLDLEVISEYRYQFKKICIQAELLNFLQDLPFCVGLGVKGDVYEIDVGLEKEKAPIAFGSRCKRSKPRPSTCLWED